MFDLSIIMQHSDALILGGIVTLEINTYSMLIGTFFAALLCYSSLSKHKILRIFSRIYVDIFRAIPLLVLMIWLFFALPLLPLGLKLNSYEAAVISLALTFSAFAAEIFRSGHEGIDSNHLAAAKNLGASRWSIFKELYIPMLFRNVAPPIFNLYINQFKLSVLASAIAVPELLHRVQTISSETFKPLELYTSLAVFFIVFVLLLTSLQRSMERNFSKTENDKSEQKREKLGVNSRPELNNNFVWESQCSRIKMLTTPVQFGQQTILNHIELELLRNEPLLVVGANGSGKSTFFNKVADINSREITFHGSDGSLKRKDLVVSVIYQQAKSWPHLTVEENLKLALIFAGRDKEMENENYLSDWIGLFKLSGREKVKAKSLSGGENQRLLICRSLIVKPDVLIMDEPTSALDFLWEPYLSDIIRLVAAKHVPILVVTHSKVVINRIGGKLTALEDGTIYEDNTPSGFISALMKSDAPQQIDS